MGKKFTLFLAFMVSALFLSAQGNVTKNKVLIETFGGTWCVFCPGASLACDDMILNGHDVAIIEFHIGDSYETSSAGSRDSYYGVTGYPTQVFDGTNQWSGGNATTSTYSSYLSAYNSAISVMTPIDFQTDLEVDLANNMITLKAIVEQVASLPSGAAPVLYVALTESHIDESWFVLDEINFVERGMYPNANGTALSLNIGTSDTISIVIPFNPLSGFNPSFLDVVAFIQDPASKTVFNAGTEKVIRHDAAVVGLASPLAPLQCIENDPMPEINLKNQGGETLTSLDIEYSVNGQTPQVLNWTGSLDFNEEEGVPLPLAGFTANYGVNTFQAILKNPNGVVDQVFANDTINGNWVNSLQYAGQYKFELRPDFLGSNITWEVLDPSGATVVSGGPYANNDTTLKTELFDLGANPGCHTFKIYDAGGNGLTTLFPGYYKLLDPNGTPLIQSLDGDFGAEDGGNFEVVYPTAIDELEEGIVNVFPNPTSGQFTVNAADFAGKEIEITVYQMNGAVLNTVVTRKGSHQFDLSRQPAGIYLLKVETEQGIHLEKIARH